MKPLIGLNDHVLCGRLGSEEFKVVGGDADHFELVSTVSGTRELIYKAHCHVPPQLRLANNARRVERAAAIGRPKR